MAPVEHPTIFLVDDDSEQLDLLASFLNRLGFSTATACDGQEALELLLRSYALPSLILLDLNMPQMDGWEFLERKRDDPELAPISVVIITGDRVNAPKNIPALSKPLNLRSLALAANFYCNNGNVEMATMIKRIIGRSDVAREPQSEEKWLAVEQLAEVEVTSEAPNFPIESAILPGRDGRGWRAAENGEQIIRLIFNAPTPLRRIKLQFSETQTERTQEFVLRWSNGRPFREIVRQQWTFSPQGSTSEVEDYRVDLDQVRVLELALKPHLSPNNAVASLAMWRLA